MRGKRFRPRRTWHNTIVWGMISGILLLIGVLVAAAMGNFLVLASLVGLAVVGAIISLLRDRAVRCMYVLEGDELILQLSRMQFRIALKDVQDASLVERSAAREYIRQKLRFLSEQGMGRAGVKARERAYVRYCSVDIGLRSLSMGLGRRMIDRMKNARHDLVLLRLRNGDDHLLSPIHNQDLVAGINRSTGARKRA